MFSQIPIYLMLIMLKLKKKVTSSNEELAIKAIKKGFEELSYKILLEEDIVKLSQLKFSEIKELVKYYQISNNQENNISPDKINFNIAFDKEKIHDLFYKDVFRTLKFQIKKCIFCQF